jgi:transcriptional regulator with XRE-family HTH domain
MNVTQKTIGERIALLRKNKGMSQEDLARRINMSRPSFAQIELGNRRIDIFELQQLSEILNFSLDEIMSSAFATSNQCQEPLIAYQTTPKERISSPRFQLDKCQNVILYVLEKCAGRPNVGETVFYKLMYFSDFNCYEMYEEHLSGMSYRKLPFGPIPQNIDPILNQMLENMQIQRVKTTWQEHAQTRYIPLIKADLTTFKANEKEIIDRVIEQLGDWSVSALNNYSQKDMPWLATKDGELIAYELVFYREFPFSVRMYDSENAE